MATLSIQEFLKKSGGTKDNVNVISSASPVSPVVPEKSIKEKAGEISSGIFKGAVEGTVKTAQVLQTFGQNVIGGLDPTQTVEQVKSQTGFKSLQGSQAEEINKQLESKTGYEKAGKVIEFVAELIFPVGKTTEVASLVNKGKTVASNALDNLAEKAQTIGDDVVEGGVKVKDKLIDIASKLDDKTKTALTRTPKEVFDKVVEQGKKAMTDDRITTPIENVGKSLVEQAQKVKNRLSQIGKQKGEVLNKAKNAYQDVSKEVGDTILNLRKQATQLGEEDAKFVNGIIDRLKPYLNKGRLKDVDTLIDDIQDQIYKLSDSEKAVQLTDRAMGIIRNGIEGLNGKIQAKVGGSYQNLNKQYSELYRLLTDVNRAVGRKGERAGSFMKQFFSPAGQTAKNIVAQMEKITGVDFSRDARLSKFVMEALGDKRVESLLEQIPKNTPTGFVDAGQKLLEYAMKKMGVDDPIEAARIFIEKGGK